SALIRRAGVRPVLHGVPARAARHRSPGASRERTRMLTTREELLGRLGPQGAAWLDAALAEVSPGPAIPASRGLPSWELRFAEAGRECGPAEAAEAARVLILRAARPGAAAVARLYARGTGAERRAVLLALA